jgi:hypothetical protein
MEVSYQFLILVPVILGIVQAIKTFGMSSRYAPVVSICLGVLGAIFLVGGLDKASALQGFIAGLSAAGLWDISKKTIMGY